MLTRSRPTELPSRLAERQSTARWTRSTFRLRVGCFASAWMAPDGYSLLTLDASSVQMAPDGYRRIVWDDQMDDHGASDTKSNGKASQLVLSYHQRGRWVHEPSVGRAAQDHSRLAMDVAVGGPAYERIAGKRSPRTSWPMAMASAPVMTASGGRSGTVTPSPLPSANTAP